MTIAQLELPFNEPPDWRKERAVSTTPGTTTSITAGMTITTVPIKWHWATRQDIPRPLRQFYETLARYRSVQPPGKYAKLRGLVALYMELVADRIQRGKLVSMSAVSSDVRELLPVNRRHGFKIDNVMNTGMARLLLKMVPEWEKYIKVSRSRIFAHDPDLAINGVDINRKDGLA